MGDGSALPFSGTLRSELEALYEWGQQRHEGSLNGKGQKGKRIARNATQGTRAREENLAVLAYNDEGYGRVECI